MFEHLAAPPFTIPLGFLRRTRVEQLAFGWTGRNIEKNSVTSTHHERLARHGALEQRNLTGCAGQFCPVALGPSFVL